MTEANRFFIFSGLDSNERAALTVVKEWGEGRCKERGYDEASLSYLSGGLGPWLFLARVVLKRPVSGSSKFTASLGPERAEFIPIRLHSDDALRNANGVPSR